MPSSGHGLRVLNPIWLIALFVGLTEVTTSVAATQSSGWTQGTFTVFSVIFPVGVASVFFLMLWRKPAALYAPGDYTEPTSVSVFAAALNSSANKHYATFESVVQSAIEDTLPRFLLDAEAGESRRAVSQAVAAAEADLRSRVIEVDISPIERHSREPLRIPVAENTTVSEVVDQVWFALSDTVVPVTLNREWVLVDASSGRTIEAVGREWAQENLQTDRDLRLLAEAGIEPGARWIAYRLDAKGRRVLRQDWGSVPGRQAQ